MATLSEPVDSVSTPRPAGLAAFGSWAVLWLVFIAAAAILGCVAATQGR